MAPLTVHNFNGMSYVIPEEDIQEITHEHESKTLELSGSCRVSIKFNNRAEYLKWCKYISPYSNRWDFEVQFPAIMRKTYTFRTSLDVELMTKQLVSLLQMGFNISMANFELDQKEVATDTPSIVEEAES